MEKKLESALTSIRLALKSLESIREEEIDGFDEDIAEIIFALHTASEGKVSRMNPSFSIAEILKEINIL